MGCKGQTRILGRSTKEMDQSQPLRIINVKVSVYMTVNDRDGHVCFFEG